MINADLKNIEINSEFKRALLSIEEKRRNVFITGRAGTGKSTLLLLFRSTTKKNIVVLAPTGIAAVNIGGQTIHSFFGFKPDITPERAKRVRPKNKALYRKLDALVIDEISMVRADLLDCVDVFLRKNGKAQHKPFGGLQIILIGDLYQLPPVVPSRERELFRDYYKSPFFFDSQVFRRHFWPETAGTSEELEYIELNRVYRQTDSTFIRLLNTIRNNTADEDDLEEINSRFMPGTSERPDEFTVYLTTTNALSDRINRERLDSLRGRRFRYEGTVEGDFDLKSLPTSPELILKKGAQVMLLNNDPHGRWINGSIGKVAGFEHSDGTPGHVSMELQDGQIVEVSPFRWEMFEFRYDKAEKRIISESTGSFTQLPLKLAWSVTIHKSQGMTFDRVIIDIGSGTFTHGQMYVALSRCTTLEGILLKKPVTKKNILMDWRVVDFITSYQYSIAGSQQPLEEKLAFVKEAIRNKRKLEITYLKKKDERSKRVIIPSFAGNMEYRGNKFPGIKAFCTDRYAERVFHLERILEMRVVDKTVSEPGVLKD